MAKKKVEKPQREVTKHQLSRWQQQQKKQRIIFIAGLFVIVAAVGIMLAGWVVNEYRPLHETVIRVNGTTFNMGYYIKMLAYYGRGQSALSLQSMADDVVRVIEEGELMKQGAARLGIAVSNEEVDAKLKEFDPPLSKDYRDVIRPGVLVEKLRDEHFEQEVPLSAQQRDIMAMLLESKSQASEVRSRMEAGEEFAELAGTLSLDSLSRARKGGLGWRPRAMLDMVLGTEIPGEYAFSSEIGALSQPIYDAVKIKGVGYWIARVAEKNEDNEEVHLQVILSGSLKAAQEVRARLEAGEEFAAQAQEFSQHEASKENGGDLGWVTKGTVTTVLEEFAFSAELDELSGPLRDDTAITEGGYWLIKVIDIDEDRDIGDDDRDLLKSDALDNWIEALWADPANVVESYLDDVGRVWAAQRAERDMRRSRS
ncbi:MAG: peptidylprolyl isomerase [Chloroflexota bacterium]